MQAAAQFSPLQRQQLIALRAKFLRDIDEVVAERRVLTQGIKVIAIYSSWSMVLASSCHLNVLPSGVFMSLLSTVSKMDLAATPGRNLFPSICCF